MKVIFLNCIFILILIPQAAQAQVGAKAKLFFIEVNSLFGWGSSQKAADTQVPTIGTFGAGVDLGLNIKKFSLGISYDYRVLTQYSEVDLNVGNRRGTFVSPLSLLLRINFEKIKFGLMLINNGVYELTNMTASGNKVVYTEPSGMRFDIVFKKIHKITPLIFYESVSFSGMQIDGVKSSLNSNLIFSSFGAGIKYDF